MDFRELRQSLQLLAYPVRDAGVVESEDLQRLHLGHVLHALIRNLRAPDFQKRQIRQHRKGLQSRVRNAVAVAEINRPQGLEIRQVLKGCVANPSLSTADLLQRRKLRKGLSFHHPKGCAKQLQVLQILQTFEFLKIGNRWGGAFDFQPLQIGELRNH